MHVQRREGEARGNWCQRWQRIPLALHHRPLVLRFQPHACRTRPPPRASTTPSISSVTIHHILFPLLYKPFEVGQVFCLRESLLLLMRNSCGDLFCPSLSMTVLHRCRELPETLTSTFSPQWWRCLPVTSAAVSVSDWLAIDWPKLVVYSSRGVRTVGWVGRVWSSSMLLYALKGDHEEDY